MSLASLCRALGPSAPWDWAWVVLLLWTEPAWAQAIPDHLGPFPIQHSWHVPWGSQPAGARTIGTTQILALPEAPWGMFWTAGNPAGLAREADEKWSSMTVGFRESEGSYRRLSDPGRWRGSGAEGLGWRPLGTGGVFGRISVTSADLSETAPANLIIPSGTSPHQLYDETGSRLKGTSARLEGIGGWTVWGLDAGLGLMYEAHSAATVETQIPRQFRSAGPEATVGIAFAPGDRGVRLGIHLRHALRVQTTVLHTVAGPSVEYEVAGLSEPREVIARGTYRRRVTDSNTTLALSGTGKIGSVGWVASGRYHWRSEVLWYELRVAEPQRDHWNSSGWESELSIRVPLMHGRLLLTTDAGVGQFSGLADRLDRHPDDQVTDSRTHGWIHADLRLTAIPSWTIVARAGVGRASWELQDPLVFTGTHIRAWTPQVGITVVRKLDDHLSVELGVAGARYSPSGAVPEPSALGPHFREWIAPDLALAGNPGRYGSASVTVGWETADRGRYFFGLDIASASGSQGPLGGLAPLPGERASLTVRMGVVLPN